MFWPVRGHSFGAPTPCDRADRTGANVQAQIVQGLNCDRASIVQGADRVGAPATSISVSTTNHNRARERADDRRRQRECRGCVRCRRCVSGRAPTSRPCDPPRIRIRKLFGLTNGRARAAGHLSAPRIAAARGSPRGHAGALSARPSASTSLLVGSIVDATRALRRRHCPAALRPAGRPRRLIERPGTPAPLARSAPEAVSDGWRSGAAVRACRVAVAVPSLAVIGRPGAGRRWP